MTIRKILARLTSTIVIAAMLASCTNIESPTFKKTNDKIDNTQTQDLGNRVSQINYLTDPVYTGHARLSTRGLPLPKRVESPTFVLSLAPGLSLNELADRIAFYAKMPVDVDDSAGGDTDTGAGQVASGDAASILNRVNGGVAAPIGSARTISHTKPIDHIGALSETLRQIERDYDVEYSYDGNRLLLTGATTEVFKLKIPPISDDVSDQLVAASGSNNSGSSSGTTGGSSGSASSGSGSSGGGASGADGSDTISTSAKYEVWADFEKTLLLMSGSDKLCQPNHTAGIVVCNARPSIRRKVRQFVQKINKIFSAQVKIEISLVLININDNSNFGLDLNVLFRNAASGLQTGVSSLLPTLSSNAGATSIGIINPPAGSHSAHFATTQAVVNSVAQANRLADQETANAIIQNNIPTPIDLSTNQDIVRNIQIQTVAQAGATSVQANASTINYGFTAQIIPRIIDDGTVDLFVKVTSNDLASLTPFAVGASENLQLATITQRRLKNALLIGSGQTLVAAGYEQIRSSGEDTGRGDDPGFKLLGGDQTRTYQKTRLVLLVTPTVLPDPVSTEEASLQ